MWGAALHLTCRSPGQSLPVCTPSWRQGRWSRSWWWPAPPPAHTAASSQLWRLSEIKKLSDVDITNKQVYNTIIKQACSWFVQRVSCLVNYALILKNESCNCFATSAVTDTNKMRSETVRVYCLSDREKEKHTVKPGEQCCRQRLCSSRRPAGHTPGLSHTGHTPGGDLCLIRSQMRSRIRYSPHQPASDIWWCPEWPPESGSYTGNTHRVWSSPLSRL